MASVMLLPISFVVMLMTGYDLIGPSIAFDYYVGAKHGWSLNPSYSFNNWASHYRFQLHDSLIFKYKNGTDSVLQVDQDHYTTCNTTNPLLALQNNGDSSTFNLNHSGLFFFISGDSDNCKKGQKVIVLVMAPRNASPTPAPSPTPFRGTSTSPDISPVASPIPQESGSPTISPAPSVPSEAASPYPQGPSQAPPPDDGKSASAAGLGGDIVTVVVVVVVFWMTVY